MHVSTETRKPANRTSARTKNARAQCPGNGEEMSTDKSAAESFGPSNFGNLTLKEIASNKLTQLSLEYWAPVSDKVKKPYDAAVIENIYDGELKDHSSKKKVMLLELSFYLEMYVELFCFNLFIPFLNFGFCARFCGCLFLLCYLCSFLWLFLLAVLSVFIFVVVYSGPFSVFTV
jgi:hypothetical protein